MLPDPDSFMGRFGEWLMAQPEAQGPPGIEVIDLMNVISNMVHMLRQTFRATEVPHLLSYIAFRSEQLIRESGGLWLYDENGERFRIPLAEEADEDSKLIDFLYAAVPNDPSGTEEN